MSEKIYRIKNSQGLFYSSGSGNKVKFSTTGKFFTGKRLKTILNYLIAYRSEGLIDYPASTGYYNGIANLPEIFKKYTQPGGYFDGWQLIEYDLVETDVAPLQKLMVERLVEQVKDEKLHPFCKKLLDEMQNAV